MSIEPGAVLAVGHHLRFGPIILGLVVLAAVVFGIVRLADRRRARAEHESDNVDVSRAGASRPSRATVAPIEEVAPETSSGIAAEPAGHGVRDAATEPIPTRLGGAPNGDIEMRNIRRHGAASTVDGDWAVETHGLTKRFGDTVAVDEVELLVPRGSAFGYLGPNGAGKTTLIRTLLGLTKADKGTMALLGFPVPRARRDALARVGAIVDEPRFHRHLTGRENLALLAAARGGGAERRIDASLSRVGLADRADRKVGSYSMGMRQRLGVAGCLLGDPQLLILDEPMNGLDPAGMQEMRTMIGSLVDEGRTVVLSSHLLDEVERTCDAVAIVDHGRVIRQGPIDTLIRGAGNVEVRISSSDAIAAAQTIEESGLARSVSTDAREVVVLLPDGGSREMIAEINRRLVEAGFSVYGIREVRTSLEDWFLSVTSRLG
ncbi:MAG: ABC transporter ATP-binding protein, partial [Acidimicrobiales bacterium]